MDYLPEMLSIAGLSVISWFCKRVLVSLDDIKYELHRMGTDHGERLARLEAVSHPKCAARL